MAVGNAKLRAGSAVSIAQVGDTFLGKYTLTRTRHVFDDDGYRTEFEISGMQDRSTLGLMSLERAPSSRPLVGPAWWTGPRLRRTPGRAALTPACGPAVTGWDT